MILGVGTDIVDIRRIAQLVQDDKFIARCFTAAEQNYANQKSNTDIQNAFYAKRFAAKEACAKALGCGIGGEASFLDIECLNDERGAPYLNVAGAAAARLRALCPDNHTPVLHISLSDEPPYALAYVVISATP